MVWNPVSYASPGEVMAAGIVLPVVAAIIVACRFHTRFAQETKIGIDDWFILGALLLNIGMGVCMIIGVAKQVLGYITPKVEYSTKQEALTGIVPEIVTTAKIEYAFQLMMITSYGLIKLSVIFFCRRIFVVNKNALFNKVIIAAAVTVSVWAVAFFFAFAFVCGTHFSANWGSAEDIVVYCQGGQAAEKGLAISDLITDVLVIGLPIPMVWRLHASRAHKIAVTAALLLGAMAIAASIARLAIYLILFSRGSDPNRDRDQTVTIAIYWSMIEASLAIVGACLPSLRFLFKFSSAQSLVRSVRSALSLQSLEGSRGSKNSKNSKHSPKQTQLTADKYTKMQDTVSETSRTRIVGENHTLATATGGGAELQNLSRPGEIHVQKSFWREDCIV